MSHKGFTLIELLVVVAILGIFAATGIPLYRGYLDAARMRTAQNHLRSIYLMQIDFYSENGRYHTTTTGSNQADSINANLFNNDTIINNSANADYIYWIAGNNTAFNAVACETPCNSAKSYTITHNNVTSDQDNNAW